MVGGKDSNEGEEIPLRSGIVVMKIKKIIDCSEAVIYAALKDCNMDPIEAINKLLSQDSFHEVKSKPEKKRENKDIAEGRTQGFVGTSSGGGRSGTGRYGRGSSTQFSSSDPVVSYGMSTYKDNESTSHPASLSSVPGTTRNTRELPPPTSDSALASIKASEANIGDGLLPLPFTLASIKASEANIGDELLPLPQPSSGYQPGWAARGKMSMADIVKMGKPQNKSSGAPNASDHHGRRTSNLSTDVNPSPVLSTTMDALIAEGWEPASSPDVTPILEPPSDFKLHDDAQGLQDNKIVQEPGVSISLMSADLETLNIQDDDKGSLQDSGPCVVIPDHLQVQTGDFSHLSFGTFKLGTPYSAPLTSIPVKTNIREETSEPDATAIGQSEARNLEYYEEGSYLDGADGNLYHRAGANTSNYDSPSASQQEPVKHENPGVVEHVYEYASTTSSPGYTFENTHQPNIGSSQTYLGPQMQNNDTFSNAMLQGYSDSLPSTLLAANINSGREIDFPDSPFSMNQSTQFKCANDASSVSGSALSMPEALNTVGYSLAQPTQQSLSATTGAPGSAVPQHLSMHPYSQATLPLDPYTTTIGYPFMPPSYSYLPSAYQQAFPGNNYNHQSPTAAALLQRKMSVPASNLPQSASVASGYGAFRNPIALPGNYSVNQTAAASPLGPTINYDDLLSAQYKDLMSLQQSENSAMWLQGLGSRTRSSVPANTYYGMQGQNQQAVGLRQAQQPSQNYGNLGYQNLYHAQAGLSMDHEQQQNPRDASLGGSQGQAKQSQLLWPYPSDPGRHTGR